MIDAGYSKWQNLQSYRECKLNWRDLRYTQNRLNEFATACLAL